MSFVADLKELGLWVRNLENSANDLLNEFLSCGYGHSVYLFIYVCIFSFYFINFFADFSQRTR